MKISLLKIENITKILTYLGALPFIIMTILKMMNINYFLNMSVNSLIITYSTIIISFICGMHFHYAIASNKNIKFLFISNIITLIAWSSLFMPIKISFTILIVCYIFNLIIDFLAYKKLLIQKWFFKMRQNISIIVILCLLANIL